MPSVSDLTNQGFYSPLSQSMTDSENSENDELPAINNSSSSNSNILNKTINRKMSINSQSIGGAGGGHGTLLLGGHSGGGGGGGGGSGSNNFINYSNLNDVNNGHFRQPNSNQFDSVADNVAILMNVGIGSRINSEQYGLKFSRIRSMRKCCFCMSILIFILTVVLLLWVLPCSDDFICNARNNHLHTTNWIKKYEKLELKGGINVIDGAVHGKSKNLVFIYRGDKIWSTKMESSGLLLQHPQLQNHQKRNGIISFMGNTGEISWFDEIKNEPDIIDCGLIDADGNGSPDCLVLDEYGELGCINPITGQWLWHIVDRTVKNSALLSFPLILPDLNNDGVKELLITSSTPATGSATLLPMTITTNFWYNTLNIVSGKTGLMIGTGFTFSSCSFIHKFQLDKRYKVSFNCIHNETEIQIIKPLEELFQLITNKTIKLSTSSRPSPLNANQNENKLLNQHKFYGQRKDTLLQRNIYSVSGKQLIVENNGKCPIECNVTVQLVEQKNGKENVIPIVNGTRMYGMVPALLTFNSSSTFNHRNDLIKKSIPIHGFVIKFWEWSPNETSIFSDVHTLSTRTSNRRRRRRRRNIPRNNSTINAAAGENTINNTKHSSSSSVIETKVRLIKETVVLIVFNSTEIRFESTSQNSIIQLCQINHVKKHEEELICQPDLNYQENSVLIADIDNDGAQELVTYYSTFINVGDGDHMDWRLTTYMQLLRLEAELPKLYVEENKH